MLLGLLARWVEKGAFVTICPRVWFLAHAHVCWQWSFVVVVVHVVLFMGHVTEPIEMNLSDVSENFVNRAHFNSTLTQQNTICLAKFVTLCALHIKLTRPKHPQHQRQEGSTKSTSLVLQFQLLKLLCVTDIPPCPIAPNSLSTNFKK